MKKRALESFTLVRLTDRRTDRLTFDFFELLSEVISPMYKSKRLSWYRGHIKILNVDNYHIIQSFYITLFLYSRLCYPLLHLNTMTNNKSPLIPATITAIIPTILCKAVLNHPETVLPTFSNIFPIEGVFSRRFISC